MDIPGFSNLRERYEMKLPGPPVPSPVCASGDAPLTVTSDIEMFQGNPLDFVDDVVAVFQRAGRSNNREWLDWYFAFPGSQPVFSWMLRSRKRNRVVGLISVVPRTFRRSRSLLSGGVVGNLFVDKEARGTLAALQLLRATKSLVSDGHLDLLLALPNSDTESLLLRMGFQAVGRWQTSAFVFSSCLPLRATLGVSGAVLGPFVDLGAGLLRNLRRSNASQVGFDLIELNAADLRGLPTDSWASSSEHFELVGDPAFLEGHYLRDIYKAYGIWGISDGDSICGYVVVNSTRGGFHICDCRTNVEKLSHIEAILILCANKRFAHSCVAVTTLRSTPIAKSLSRAGAVRVPARFGAVSCALLGYWRPDHPLASEFPNPERWNVYIGTNDV